MKLSVHLKFQGQAEQAFTFYKDVFHTKINACFKYSEMGEITGDDALDNKIAHISIVLGEGAYLMGYDVQEDDFTRNKVQDTFISLEIESNQELERIFKELSQGGEALQEPSDEPWGYYAVVIDRFGVEWELMNSDSCRI